MSSTAKLQRAARKWHSKISSILFLFFFFISITGILLGWKSLFASKVYSSGHKQEQVKSLKNWLPLDSLQQLAIAGLKEKLPQVDAARAINLTALLDKGSVRFTFKNQYMVQLNAQTGELVSIEKKATDLFIKIHDGEIVDDWFGTKGTVKTTYVSIMGLALFFLTLSGFWMRFMPKRSA
jgi:uncharacterized iron-regulated membrane protein